MKAWFSALLASAACLCLASSAIGAETPDLQAQFETTVRPFIGTYCTACHSGNTPAAQFDLKAFTSLDAVKADFGHWSLVADRLSAQEMPPKPRPAPPAELVAQVIAWVHAVRTEEIDRLAGDPGTVLARRLSNAEYDYTIRDLTGQDMQVAREFPVDPANTAGFDNSGESLTMSPALLNKYLQAARQVADHMYLQPNGFDFAPYGMQVETDREKYSIQSILAFYAAQPTDYAQYFEAAWRYRYRGRLGNAHATLASIAVQQKVSAQYLPKVWAILHDGNAIGPVATLQKMWNGLPVPAASHPDAGQQASVEAQAAQMRDFVTRIRTHTAMQFSPPHVEGLPGQSEPLHNWRLKQYAAHHRDSDPNDLRADSDPVPAQQPVPKFPPLHADASPRWAIIAANARANDADLVYPAGQRARYQKAFARFATVFPDTFYVTERGRYWPDDSEDQGRLLSAGYHNSGGYYRDDTALMQLILDKNGRRQLNELWNEFDFDANQTANTWTQYYFNQSGEVDGKGDESGSPRPTDHQITDTSVIAGLRDKYLAKAAANPKNSRDAVPAIRDYFGLMNATLRNLEKARAAAEPRQLTALLEFAQRSYRRPLTAAERADLLDYYRTLRSQSKISHEDAVRETIVRILMSPDFLYRFDLSQPRTASAKAGLHAANAYISEPLSDYSLASRLSYFLWSSMPDTELLRHAAAGDLHKPAVLLAQTRRMLKDERVRGLATEFTGNWLGFRQFENDNSIDRTRFPTFNDDLREAMFQEPIHFVQDNIIHDGSVLDLVYGNYTFVNPPLARHYGMPDVPGDVNNWVRVDNADKYQRGGILPMAVFMTEYSPGLRTSPVKRGNWVVQKVLGIRVPPPPPVVPELPSDETKSDLSVRDLLAQHRANPVCAACHARFDSFGLAFEGYGPVGEARTHDLAGRLVDTSVTFPQGVEGTGLAGLQAFIRGHRQDQFLDNISRKLLAFALDRSLQLSDEALIDQMKAGLAANNYRFRSMVEAIVVSPEFRTRRADAQTPAGQDAPQSAGAKLIKIDFMKAKQP